ncbi:MAG TPA: hypothetical protein VF147_11440 [Vicinamibacterales bacterium]
MDSREPKSQSAPSSARVERGHRRPYLKPELTAYGPLAKLTRGSQSGTGENTAQGGMMKTCL